MTMRIENLHQEQLQQLTGCRYATLIILKQKLETYFKNKRGRPFKQSAWLMLIVTLMKFRSETAYRTLGIILHINYVSIHRYVNRLSEMLSEMPLTVKSKIPDLQRYLIVDGTCTRVRSSDMSNYSGYT